MSFFLSYDLRMNFRLLIFTCILAVFVASSCSTSTTSISRKLSPRAPASDSISMAEEEEDTSQEDIEDLIPAVTQSVNEPKVTLSFDWPVDDARLTRGFMPKKRRPHYGLDLAAPKGTSIYTAHAGMVVYVGRDFRGFGKMVLVESGFGWATIYAHLDRFMVREGQILKKGDLVGLMGRTGRATGVHLHFEIRKNKAPVDPLLYLPGGTKISKYVSDS
jgi:murein DD-endopeptidase MepM/ murein hydrolase activator NlpD